MEIAPSARRALVETTIESAFAGVTLGSGISIRQSQVIDRYGEGCTDEEFGALPKSEVTNDWGNIPEEELERICVAHLDPEGWRYYIPALALSIMRNYDGCSMRVIGTISSLYPKADSWHYHVQRYDVLNARQKFALALFLRHLPELAPLKFDEPKQVTRALRNYWQDYLATPNGT